MAHDDPELAALRADLDRTYGEGRWYCFRGVPGENGEDGLLYAWLMAQAEPRRATSPPLLMSGRTPAAVEARIMTYYRVLAHPDEALVNHSDPMVRRSAARQARDAAEALDVSEYES